MFCSTPAAHRPLLEDLWVQRVEPHSGAANVFPNGSVGNGWIRVAKNHSANPRRPRRGEGVLHPEQLKLPKQGAWHIASMLWTCVVLHNMPNNSAKNLGLFTQLELSTASLAVWSATWLELSLQLFSLERWNLGCWSTRPRLICCSLEEPFSDHSHFVKASKNPTHLPCARCSAKECHLIWQTI